MHYIGLAILVLAVIGLILNNLKYLPLAIIGAVIGFFLGGPIGAGVGFFIGLAIPNITLDGVIKQLAKEKDHAERRKAEYEKRRKRD